MPYLTPEKVTEVRELLAAGASNRKAAKQAGCSVWSVRQVRAGRHRPRYRNPKRYATQDAWKKRLTPEERKKLMPRTRRCSCGLLIRTKTCRRCAVVGTLNERTR